MQGERAKYFVRSNKSNFSFQDNSYWLEILFGLQGRKIVIPKSEFLFLSDHWIFSFPTDNIIGPVKARLVMEIFDPDCPDGLRTEVDEQYIGVVISNPCPQFFRCPPCGSTTQEIVYERTEASDIGERYARLCDRDGNPIKTNSDGFLYVLRNI